MNKKRFFAVLAAATMLVSAVPVSASEVTPEAVTVTDQSTSTTITGSGTNLDFNKTPIYKVTLPTSNSLDFIVDPHGLVNLASGASMDVDLTATGCGAVLAKDDAVAFIKNQSSVDVVVTTTFHVNAAGVTLVTDSATDADVAVATSQSILLCAVPSASQALTETDYVATGKAVAIYEGSTLAFRLNKADYVVKNDNGSYSYVIKDGDNNWDSTAFKIGGKVNKQADWKDASISINAVFEFKQATDADVVLATDSGVYNVVSGTAVLDYEPVVREDIGSDDEAGSDDDEESGKWTVNTAGTRYTLKAVTESGTTAITGSDVATVTIDDSEIPFSGSTNLSVDASMVVAYGYSADSEDLVFVVTMKDGTVYRVVK